MKEPRELWEQAGGDPLEYQRLMVEAGHIVDVEPCALCGGVFRHRHAFVDGADKVIRIDIFGHDESRR